MNRRYCCVKDENENFETEVRYFIIIIQIYMQEGNGDGLKCEPFDAQYLPNKYLLNTHSGLKVQKGTEKMMIM